MAKIPGMSKQGAKNMSHDRKRRRWLGQKAKQDAERAEFAERVADEFERRTGERPKGL